jgi:hypothetical protein
MNILLLIVDASLIRSTLHFDDEREAAKRRRVEKKRKTSGGQGLADLVSWAKTMNGPCPSFLVRKLAAQRQGVSFVITPCSTRYNGVNYFLKYFLFKNILK